MTKQIKPPFRRFLGEEPIRPEANCTKEALVAYKQAMSFHGIHLKAYLKGWVRFPYKRDEFGELKYFPVQQEYLKKEDNNGAI